MNLDEVEQLLSVARVVYQVELAGDQDHLVDASEMELAICPPGCQGPDGQYRPELWAVGLGEQGTHTMVVCTGATLTEAFAALRDRVEARRTMLRGMLGGEGAGDVPPEVHASGWQWRPVTDDTAFAPPFGTIRACRCGCLVAGGLTTCVTCARAEP